MIFARQRMSAHHERTYGENGRTTVEDEQEPPPFPDGSRQKPLNLAGSADRVIEVCQQLLGETGDMAVVPCLQEFAARGHRALKTEMG